MADATRLENIAIIDDHPSVVEGVCLKLQRELPQFNVVTVPLDGELEARLTEFAPRVAIVDWSFDQADGPLPAESGTDLVRRYSHNLPGTKWVLFTGHVRPFVLKAALDAGFVGCVSKGSQLRELVAAVKAAYEGRCHFCPTTQKAFPSVAAEAETRLNEQERTILRLVHGEKEAKEIADQMGLSVKSVHNYLARLRRKLHVDSMVALARCAEERGLVAPRGNRS